jgi:adenylate cyclase
MNLFQPYKNIIASALKNNASNISMNERYFGDTKLFSLSDFKAQRTSLSISNDLVKVADEMGVVQIKEQVVGHHPHFKHLKHTKNTENHNIVSVFIDVKGSTNLFRKYNPETIYIITNTIQLVAISVCKLFGGFIHRLQGDGLFVYFGGKGVDKSKANIHALTALSFFNYFLENDLKNLFEEQGIEKIKAKVGIDFGDDNDVLWAMAGIEESSEITTISLHTSLASKMQQFAGSNEIIIGQNVVDFAKVNTTLLEVVAEQRYIFQDREKGFNYTQYKFNWLKFLKQLKHIATSSLDGSIAIKNFDKPNIYLHDSAPLKQVADVNKPWKC